MYCYRVRNIHTVSDLVDCDSEERDRAEGDSQVSSLESRVAGVPLTETGKLEEEGIGRDQGFKIGWQNLR